ncbi:Fanconi anemia group A protein homolog isoform X2 [Lytechinus pictus]
MHRVHFKPKSSNTLHEILKAWQDKPRESRKSGRKELKESIRNLLDDHHNFGELLQEVQGLQTKRSDGVSSGNNQHLDTISSASSISSMNQINNVECTDIKNFTLEVDSITSCLEHQASLTGVPISRLASKKCATLLTENTIINQTQLQDQEPVLPYLNSDYKRKIDLVVSLMKILDTAHNFHRGQFIEALSAQIQSTNTRFPPWLLWHLDRESIMTFDLFVTANLDHPTILHHVAVDLANLMTGTWQREGNTREVSRQVFIDTLIHLILIAYPGKDASLAGDSTTQSVKGMLDTVLAKLIETGHERDAGIDSHDCLLPMKRIQGRISKESCQQFSLHHITQLLCHNPAFSVTDAISKQHEWSFAKASPCILGLFRQLLIALQETDAVGLLRRVLDQEEVNWQSTLVYTSMIVIYYPLAQQLVKECISDFIEQAFESYEEDLLICAFLLVRQAANEGPHVFPSYASWFKETFSSSSTLVHKKSFLFITEFLTKLVPYESAVCLRAHVQNPPAAPSKCQEVLRDYMLLAKTRLSDLNESWQDSVFPGANKQPTASRSARPQDQAKCDVEIAVESYEKNNRIPTNVLEASIFRRPYYVTHFLPALLTPRMLPDIADAKMKLIESLKNANKLPIALYQQYEEACAKELNELLDGAFSEDVMEDCLEPLEALKAGLDKLKGIVVKLQTSQRNDATLQGEMTAEVSLLSDKIATSLGLDGPPSHELSEVSTVNINDVKPTTLHKEVAGIVFDALSNICKEAGLIRLKHEGVAMGTVQIIWAHQLIAMLSRFTELCAALYQRIWMMFCQQMQSKPEDVIVGAACFLLYTHTMRSKFPTVRAITSSDTKMPCSLLEALSSELSLSTSQQMLSAARLTSSLLHLSLCISANDTKVETILPLLVIEKFCFLIPRLCPDIRTEDCNMQDNSHDALQDDTLLAIGRTIMSSPAFRKMLPESKLSFSQWISYELEISPHEDTLMDLERHDYHQWAILCYYLPLPKAQGGCEGGHYPAVQTLINGLMDYEAHSDHQRVTNGDDGVDDSKEIDSHHHRYHGGHSTWRELLQSLQELISLVDVSQVDSQMSGDIEKSHDPWLLRMFHQREAKMKTNPDEAPSHSCFSKEAIEIQAFMRITCCLPPYLLFTSHPESSPRQKDLEALSNFIGTKLRNNCMETWGSLSYLLTAHLVKGVVMCCQSSGDSFLHPFLLSTPLLLGSTAVHWRRIRPFILQAYRQGPIPTIFQNIQDLYTAADNLTSHASGSPSSAAMSASSKTASTSSWRSLSSVGNVASSGCSVSTETRPWLCALVLYEAVRRRCRVDDRSRALTAVMQTMNTDNQHEQQVCVGLLECAIAEEAWNVLIGRKSQQKGCSVLITQHVPLLIQLVHSPSVLQHSVVSSSVVQLYPLIVMRSFLPIRSEMQSLLSQHPRLIEVLLETHNALGELYCRSGGEPLQPTRGLRRSFKPDKDEVLSTDLMLACSRFLQSCVSVCPVANLRRIRAEVMTSCDDELQAAVRRYTLDRR